ncbi:MAG: 3-oxoadipate enol-lactonase [Xanthobacter sp.]
MNAQSSALQYTTMDDGCRIGWRMDGPADAPVLVLLHALGVDGRMWAPQVEALADNFRILRPDARGHGASDAPAGAYGMDRLGRDLLTLLDVLKIEQADLCGLSMGGVLAQWMGVFAPHRVRRLVLANTSAWLGPPENWTDRIATMQAQGPTALEDGVMARWFTPGFPLCAPMVVSRIHTLFCATRTEGYAGMCAALRDMDLRPVVRLIRAPVLVITGDEDTSTPPERGRWLAQTISGAQHVELQAAHLSNVEQAEAFNAALKAFLDETG